MSLEYWLDQDRRPLTQSSDPTTRCLLVACGSGETLNIRYTKPSQPAEERSIRVRSVFTVQSVPYVEAFCLQRQAVRCFVISRIVILDGAEVAPKRRPAPAVWPVPCEIEVVELDGDYGPVDGIEATCSRCGHTTESFGTSTNSIRRCLVTMREECPRGESNYYVEE